MTFDDPEYFPLNLMVERDNILMLTDMQCMEKALATFRKRRRLNFGELKAKFEMLRISMMPK